MSPPSALTAAAPAAARAPLLAVVGYASMVPGSARHAAARIDVPVFRDVGERDIAVDHHAIPAEFPASRDITLYVLPDAGHNHNVEPGRELLWSRIPSWAPSCAGRPSRIGPALRDSDRDDLIGGLLRGRE